MMPVIRISDAIFVDLKSISKWLETGTPSETIDKLVRDKMNDLDLERDTGFEANSNEPEKALMEFDGTPGLTFTRLISAAVNGAPIKKRNWSGLLLSIIEAVKMKGLAGEKLARELQIPTRVSAYSDEGYTYYPEIGVSVQGQSAQDAWKEVDRLANKWEVPVEVHFQWRENKKAQHPGRSGVLRSG